MFNPSSESSARKIALEQGTVDVVVDGIIAADLPDLEANPDIQIFSATSRKRYSPIQNRKQS